MSAVTVEFEQSGESHNCVTQPWVESKYAPSLMRHPERHDEDDRVTRDQTPPQFNRTKPAELRARTAMHAVVNVP